MNRELAIASLFVALSAACADGGGSGGSSDDCPLDRASRGLIEETTREAIIDGLSATLHTTQVERGYGLSLPGSAELNAGFAFVIGPCTAPETFDPYCENIGGDRNKCLRLGCEAQDIALAEVYYTAGAVTLPTDRHVFEYPTEDPEGTGEYAENPLRTYRTVLVGSSANQLSAVIDESVTIETGSRAIDFAHTGSMSGQRFEEDVVAFELAFTFPALSEVGEVDVSFGITSGGMVRLGADDVLATIPEVEGPFSWREGCEP